MPKPMEALSAASRSMADLPIAALQESIELYDRRTHAIADYWTAIAAARQPADILGAQAEYWTHILQDYAAAAVQGTVKVLQAQAAASQAATSEVAEPSPSKRTASPV